MNKIRIIYGYVYGVVKLIKILMINIAQTVKKKKIKKL